MSLNYSNIWYVDILNLKRKRKQSKLIRPAAEPPLLKVTNTWLWTHTHTRTEALNSAAVGQTSEEQKIVLGHKLKSLNGNFKEHFEV